MPRKNRKSVLKRTNNDKQNIDQEYEMSGNIKPVLEAFCKLRKVHKVT